ncbi:filamentous hemagglutinin N-terminal domain-containing protein [Achromobacter kerstersii]|uniref:two-partner secretion domain-containing protein n=1 Tax=Achromobacter kerstersii TaxID=1353890 RepID=UPI0006C13EA7|nr:filamentous hemagglutinin N-terminal domain-containing protein [Achromobacter kerstersii]CUJ69155.1 Heme:hemopexin utilization protein A [Achromobacter kerstersii]
MNKTYALVWSESRRAWIAASECARRRGKSTQSGARAAAAAIALLGLSTHFCAQALPTGGTITHGDATITTDAEQMVIQQNSEKIIADWTSFDISAGNTVRFEQPSSTSAALNKVTNFLHTEINGKLEANGRVFLINPSGVIFNRGAEVNVGGLVASTQPIQDADFIGSHYVFSGDSASVVENYGAITASGGGGVALLGANVSNEGVIRAELGTIALAAGEAFTLTFQDNQLLDLQIDRATVAAIASNGHLLQANGGQVLIKADAANATLRTVINSEGIIEANTLSGKAGRIVLDGGTQGLVRVAGTMSAAALGGQGDGGAVTTRGSEVRVQQTTQTDTRANKGKSGIWNIDSNIVKVNTVGANAEGLTIHSNTLSQNLATTAVALTAVDGDLSINGPVSWASSSALSLHTSQNANFNSSVRGSGANVHLSVHAGAGALINGSLGVTGAKSRMTINALNGYEIADGATVMLSGAGTTFSANGREHTVIQNVSQLQAINKRLDGHYVLGNSMGAKANFQAIGGESGTFSGTFDGLGHTIENLSIKGSGANLGLFAASSGVIRNTVLKSVTVSGARDSLAAMSIGSLVGLNIGGELYNVKSWSTVVEGSANRENVIGGLVGTNEGAIIQRATVSGNVRSNGHTRAAGGLVGENKGGATGRGMIRNSASTATVSGDMQRSSTGGMGGLVGVNNRGSVHHSSATGKTATRSDGINVGGLVGNHTDSFIESSQAGGLVQGGKLGNTGGLVGANNGGAIYHAIASNTVEAFGAGNTGGAVGSNNDRGELLNVRSNGKVADWEGHNVGGLVGANVGSDSLIEEGHSTGRVDARQSQKGAQIGGLVGYNSGVIRDSESHASVETGHNASAGGLVGTNDGRLQRVRANGNVTAYKHSSVGGLVGTNNGRIDSAVASGAVWGHDQSRIGGIAGVNARNGFIFNATARGTLEGAHHTTIGGIAGLNQGLIEGSSAAGRIKTHWYTWLLGQTHGVVAGKNTGIIR